MDYEMKVKNRRKEADSESRDWWDMVYTMGMPTLYILGLIMGIVGAICMGTITRYWSELTTPTCFLYSQTASHSIFYHFGSSLSVCNWVTYGATTGLLLAVICGIYYAIKVRGRDEVDLPVTLVTAGIILATLLLLAASCTLAEGMRITCASMGLNSANNKGSSCYNKLDTRVMNYNLPIQTSTMVRISMYSMWGSTAIFFCVTYFHLAEHYRRIRLSD
ncbi:uncharacterized protein [Panulirus ornatus]|uniref:uncharacterized protein n=1 Tax=Panulirus ornatus TaxID=150431 RepID=UPI003A8AF180